jgi:hypothetical protein
MSDGATEIDKGICQAVVKLFALNKWANYSCPMRSSYWTRVYIKIVIEACKKITKKTGSSPEQFNAVAILWIGEYCDHEVPSVQV